MIKKGGVLDTAFGNNGVTFTNFTNDSGISSITTQADGKIVAARSYYNSDNNNLALARFNTDGSLDSSFNAGGIVYTDLNAGSDDGLNSVLIQTDGRIVAAGGSRFSSTSDADFALVRYTSSGALDTSFTTSGKMYANFHVTDGESVRQVVFQEDGSLVLAGFTMYTPSKIQFHDFALARVENVVEPLATTKPATAIGINSSVLNSTVNAYYHDVTVTFEYGTDTSYGTTVTVPAAVTGAAKTNVTYHLTGLKYNTTYHYRVVASNSIGTTYGKDQTFTTPAFFAYLPIILR